MDMLDGIRVLSFNHFLLGPVGVQVLADLGADVIAIEPVHGGFQRHWGGRNRRVDDHSVLHLCGNRNKRSLAIDLKTEAGREIINRLVKTADVVSENFRPGIMDKLGFGYDAVRDISPNIIYASASGYGRDGPYKDRPGQDLVVQALSGLANINGSIDQPPTPVGVSAADHHGAQILAMSIMAALFRRERTGKGCRVDVNLLSAALDLQMESLVCYANGMPMSQRTPPNIAGWLYPAPYGIYEVADGHMAISLGTMAAIAAALDLPALADVTADETFDRNGEIAAEIQEAVRPMTLADLEERLERHKLWYARVNDYAAVMDDPQIRHNGTFVESKTEQGSPITLVAHPVRYDGEIPPVRLPPQPLGAQTAEILAEIGYAAADIKRLAAIGAIGLPSAKKSPGNANNP